MTTQTELLEIIKNGENSGVEFKRDDLQPKDLAKELVALTNLQGGMVLLGVEDDGSIMGLTRDNLEEWVVNVCRDKIRPPINPFFEMIHDLEDGKDMAIIRVTHGYAVHALWHNSTNRYLIRVGSQSRDASQEELARLFQQRGLMRTDLRPVSGTTFAELDLRRLQDYFGNIRGQDVPAGDDADAWRTLLVNTDIMTRDGVTVGGLLLFGTKPKRFLPQAGIDAVAYPGTEMDYDMQERMTLHGPMIPLLNPPSEIVDNGLVEQALAFVQRNTGTTVISQGGRRLQRPIYPSDVLREGIVNALIHRDYQLTNTDIKLAVYRDRLEIVSPGRLPNGVTPERMRAGNSSTRNHLLKNVMLQYRYLEYMGMGIPRKIIKGMNEHNGTDPELIEHDERFTLRLLAQGPKTIMD